MIHLSLETLGREALTLGLNPELGGSVDYFNHGNQSILRPAPPGSNSPLDQAAYPLIPFSGRIDHGRFTFNERAISLPANMPPEPHAIHGQGWQSIWHVVEQTDHSATIALNYTGPEWPWQYRAEQTFALSANALRVTMSLQNLSTEPMPAGLGWHPFFPKQDAILVTEVALLWPNSETMISQSPIHSTEVDQLLAGAPVHGLSLDNAFTTEQQLTKVQWPARDSTLTLRASPELGHLVVYTPVNDDFFCVEPVSHSPNCLNSSLPNRVTGARTLASLETMQAHITITL